MANKIYVGDTGGYLEVDCESSLANATAVHLNVKKPGASEAVVWVCAVYAVDDEERLLRHEFVDGDLDVAGTYLVQPYVELELGDRHFLGNTASITVYDPFK